MDENTFMQTNRDIPIYIPLGTIDDYRNAEYWSEFTNFIEVDFEGVDENDDGPKAEAYPNPGFNLLNIKNSTPNAQVEVYDLSGKLIHKQQITDNITPITTTSWPSGTYIWKVLANGKEAESGKWIKQLYYESKKILHPACAPDVWMGTNASTRASTDYRTRERWIVHPHLSKRHG
jgi:hypothetical protein